MKGKTKPRIFKFVILAMLATILAGFFGVGGTKSADPKPIDPSNAPIDAEKFFSGDPAYKPDLYDWITIENKSLNKNGQNLEHAFRVKTIKGKGFQFDATFKQVYTKSNEELFYYQWTESDYNIAGILETSIKYFIGIDGFQNYSRNEPTKIECKKLANVNVYRMQNHPTYFLATKQGTTEPYGIIYKDSDRYPLAQGQGDTALSAYLRWYNTLYSYTNISASNIEKLFGAGTYKIPTSDNKFIDNGEAGPPEIYVAGHSFGGGLVRPPLTFKLTHVMGRSGALTADDNYFFFTTQDPSFKTTAIRLHQSGQGVIVWDASSKDWDAVNPISGRNVIIDQATWWKYIINRVYNATAAAGASGECGNVTNSGETTNPEYKPPGTEPPRQCINVSDTGWLAKWGVTYNKTSLFFPGGTSESACEKEAQCGGISGWLGMRGIMCKLGCAIYEMVGEFINWALDWLNTAAGISRNFFLPQKTYAMTPLSKSLSDNKIQEGWNYSLAITDIIVIAALMLVAFANILKINIDVYTIKKSLFPLLVGVILAHLSMLISKMLIDFASLLSQYFVDKAAFWGSGPMAGISSVSGSSASNIGDKLAALMGISPTTTGNVISVGALLGLVGLATGGTVIGCAIIALTLIVLAIPGLLIFVLAFLMYCRIYVVYVLVIISPLAFVCLGFPPAQQYFKQWWGWFLKWVFLAPIAYFLIALAAVIGGASNAIAPKASGLSVTAGWFLGIIILGAAIMVPFKMGGPIMAAWARWGKKIAQGGALAADVGISKLTHGISPRGLYLGTKRELERRLKYSTEETAAAGQAIAGAGMALPGTVFHRTRQAMKAAGEKGGHWDAIKAGLSPRARGKEIREANADRIKSQREILAGAQASQYAKGSIIPLYGQELNEFAKKSIQRRDDIELSVKALIQLASDSEINTDEIDARMREFAENYKNNPMVNAVLQMTADATVNNPNGQVAKPVKVQNGQVVEMARAADGTPEKKLFNDEKTRLGRAAFINKREYQQEQMILNIVNNIDNSQKIKGPNGPGSISNAQFDQLNAQQQQTIRFLQQMHQNQPQLFKKVRAQLRHFGRFEEPPPPNP